MGDSCPLWRRYQLQLPNLWDRPKWIPPHILWWDGQYDSKLCHDSQWGSNKGCFQHKTIFYKLNKILVPEKMYPRCTCFQEKEAVVTKTPYGGLIVWTLPGGSVLYCHLKEKAVIRNKKRWSQCMYFLYFLGHPRLPTRWDLTTAVM